MISTDRRPARHERRKVRRADRRFGSKELLPLWVGTWTFATPDLTPSSTHSGGGSTIPCWAIRGNCPTTTGCRAPRGIEARHGWRPGSGVDALHSRHRQGYRHGSAGTYPSGRQGGHPAARLPPLPAGPRNRWDAAWSATRCGAQATATKWTSSSSKPF